MNNKIGAKHLIIPDTQCRPGDDFAYLEWVGRYILDKRPDVVVHLGDHWDMPSLSSYDRGKLKFEGRKYKADIDAGNEGMARLLKPIKEYNAWAAHHHKERYKPRMILLRGNHEQRIERAVQERGDLEGMLGYHQLDTSGWEVHEFLEVVEVDGVHYSHYFYNPMSGNPWGGQASTMLKNIGFSFTMGHRQGKDQAERYLSDGTVHRGLIVGSCYEHDEEYKGPQGNRHWRGIVVKHEVNNGDYDLMEVSLDYLRRRFGSAS